MGEVIPELLIFNCEENRRNICSAKTRRLNPAGGGVDCVYEREGEGGDMGEYRELQYISLVLMPRG